MLVTKMIDQAQKQFQSKSNFEWESSDIYRWFSRSRQLGG